MGRPPNIFLKAQTHFRIGNQIIGCCKLANDTLGPIIFAEIGLALFSFAINAYFVCTFYSLFVQPFSTVVLIFIVASLMEVIMSGVRIGHLTAASEALDKVFGHAVDCLQDYKVHTRTEMAVYRI